ncbi:ly6/PLAUR domain-containing protein 1 isoform X2 [Paroedura picta]|uniref:ly6/PLAUR domain-containing protein 1 isoform X2 n=1 Tax=Paroedura picta TaxID=143630 RepID=UPI004055ED99
MWLFAVATTFWGLLLAPGFALQIQCYQCEEFQLNNDCSSPEFIVNCTVNVQDVCQKEVMEQSSGTHAFLQYDATVGSPLHRQESILQKWEETLPGRIFLCIRTKCRRIKHF